MSVSTPPPTSLSPAPSPTAEGPKDMSLQNVRPLYMIVATSVSPQLGIGLKGTLPWPAIKSDMSFFARVTKRASTPAGKNTVIMGRKTYESIPKKFRPLQGRRNLVITRGGAQGLQERLRGELDDEVKKEDVACVASLNGAVEATSGTSSDKVFVIGGAEIYKAALHEEYKGAFTHLRIVHTEIQRLDGGSLEIDTLFPVDVYADNTWRQVADREVAEWVGEELPQIKNGDGKWKEDGDFKIRMLGWEKELSNP